MSYEILQKLWSPAGSGYGKSKTTSATLKTHHVAVPRIRPVGNSKNGPGSYRIERGIDAINSGEQGVVNRHRACIEFYSIASAESAKFVPMDVEYSESFSSEWNHQSVYGRGDPLSTFQGTKRNISLQFIVNATAPEHARMNMVEISNLASLLYPTYKSSSSFSGASANVNNTSLIHTAPLLRVHFNNLILDPTKVTGVTGVNGMAKNVGLVCAAGDTQIAPVLENGVFATIPGLDENAFGWAEIKDKPKDARIYPKTFKISVGLTVYHTFPLGFERDDGNGAKGGPNAYDRGIRGFGSFPWGEKHVHDQKYVQARNKRRAKKAAKDASTAAIRNARATGDVMGSVVDAATTGRKS